MREREEIEKRLEAIIEDFRQAILHDPKAPEKLVYANLIKLLVEILLDIRDTLGEKK